MPGSAVNKPFSSSEEFEYTYTINPLDSVPQGDPSWVRRPTITVELSDTDSFGHSIADEPVQRSPSTLPPPHHRTSTRFPSLASPLLPSLGSGVISEHSIRASPNGASPSVGSIGAAQVPRLPPAPPAANGARPSRTRQGTSKGKSPSIVSGSPASQSSSVEGLTNSQRTRPPISTPTKEPQSGRGVARSAPSQLNSSRSFPTGKMGANQTRDSWRSSKQARSNSRSWGENSPTQAQQSGASKDGQRNRYGNDYGRSGGGFSYGESGGEDASPVEEEETDENWTYAPPPNNQRTFYFPDDDIEFSSEFDSGNLIQVIRLGPYNYEMYSCMDCGNSPKQTNNRQWFHFSVRGASKGVSVKVSFVGMMHSQMFTYEWMPVMAVMPYRPQYARIPGMAQVTASELIPETPGYPMLIHKAVTRDSNGDGDDEGGGGDGDNGAGEGNWNENENEVMVFNMSPTDKVGKKAGTKKKAKKKNLAMRLAFEFRIEAEVPITDELPRGDPYQSAIYIASNHPYSYGTLLRSMTTWQQIAKRSNGIARPGTPNGTSPLKVPAGGPSMAASAPATGPSPIAGRGIYLNREILCKTLDGNDVFLLTISDHNGMSEERVSLLSGEFGLPYSSVRGQSERPFKFPRKKAVILTARVHPGECAGSHLMHGCVEFLMNTKDPRAVALREHFVFYIVPMINPDGVIRGHSRVDANGTDLNRMYQAPSFKRHPAPFAILQLARSVGKDLALFIDMHAHANKKGTFFYGNGMEGARQVENLLYAKLVSLNTPYLEFNSCNFSEANMFAVSKSGKSKDCSSRVVVFTETDAVNVYTIEASHVCGKQLNTVVPIPMPGGADDGGTYASESQAPLTPAYTPSTINDTGRALLVALLDLKGLNPLSRLPATQFHSARRLSVWIQRQMQIEASELLFTLAYQNHRREVTEAIEMGPSSQSAVTLFLQSLREREIPEKLTIRNARLLPRITFSDVRGFLPIETAVTLLSQTPPAGPPRSLVSGGARVRIPSPAAATSGAEPPAPPPVIATKRISRPSPRKQVEESRRTPRGSSSPTKGTLET